MFLISTCVLATREYPHGLKFSVCSEPGILRKEAKEESPRSLVSNLDIIFLTFA